MGTIWKGGKFQATLIYSKLLKGLAPQVGLELDLENSTVKARDGIEPPPPAFSGPPSKLTKWSGISGYH
jgi:hypothetical protein